MKYTRLDMMDFALNYGLMVINSVKQGVPPPTASDALEKWKRENELKINEQE